jgi:hypothetical protein
MAATSTTKAKHEKKKLTESQIAAEYIDSMCNLLRRQQPSYSNKDIHRRILFDCRHIFPESLINSNWPPWVLKD